MLLYMANKNHTELLYVQMITFVIHAVKSNIALLLVVNDMHSIHDIM